MTDSGNFAARAGAIRETAKWIAAVFVGAGAVLFSGLSFANVAQATSSGQWFFPVMLATLPVLAAAWAVRETAAVITSEAPPIPSLLPSMGETKSAADESLRHEVQRLSPPAVAVHGSMDEFETYLSLCRERTVKLRGLYNEQRTDDRRQEMEAAYRDLSDLQEAVRDIVICADYLTVKAKYSRARKVLLFAAGIAIFATAASGVLVGAYNGGAEGIGDVGAATIRDPKWVTVYRLNETNGSTPCPVMTGDKALALGGDYLKPILLLFHVSTGSPPDPHCSGAWAWRPEAGEVAVVPSQGGLVGVPDD
jgi:hypothetical protein